MEIMTKGNVIVENIKVGDSTMNLNMDVILKVKY